MGTVVVSMQEGLNSFLRHCVLTMLKPIVRMCVARGVRIQVFIELVKEAYVVCARNELALTTQPLSISRVSVMTGIQRPEVKRFLNQDLDNKPKDFIARVIGQWSTDKRFLKNKRPRALSVRGQGSDFTSLVRLVASDLNPSTVLFELKRLGIIAVEEGHATLLTAVYLTTGDAENTLRLGSRDVYDLVTALEENASSAHEVPNLQARTEFDNVPDESIDLIREWLVEVGSTVHAQARAFLGPLDRDVSGVVEKGQGRNRIVLGTYSLIERLDLKPSGED